MASHVDEPVPAANGEPSTIFTAMPVDWDMKSFVALLSRTKPWAYSSCLLRRLRAVNFAVCYTERRELEM